MQGDKGFSTPSRIYIKIVMQLYFHLMKSLMKVKLTMARIKFVLWERYRAWWGAHELNEEDPLLIDKMKAEEELKRKEDIERKLASTPKRVLRKLRRKKRLQIRRRQARRAAQAGEQIPETDTEREARELAEFQRLAAGGASPAKTSA